MTAVLPLISPEKGTQLGFIAQGILLVVSGVYYPVEVLPQWMQWISTISPATYALDGMRDAILDGDGITALWRRDLAAARDRRRLGAARARDLPPRRALREAARQAQAVGMSIEVRTAETDADLEGWIRVKRAAFPNESAWSVQEFRERHEPDKLVLVAELDGEIVGAGLAGPSDVLGRGFVNPRVHPDARRRGVGTAMLHRLTQHVAGLGFDKAWASVDDPGSRAFAERFGFEEVDREVEQVIALPAELPEAAMPDGVDGRVDCVPAGAASRDVLARPGRGVRGLAIDGDVVVTLDDWLA